MNTNNPATNKPQGFRMAVINGAANTITVTAKPGTTKVGEYAVTVTHMAHRLGWLVIRTVVLLALAALGLLLGWPVVVTSPLVVLAVTSLMGMLVYAGAAGLR